MPLSEFYKMAREDLESTQQKTTTYSADLSHVPDNEIFELVWENGQIMMQGQSSRSRRRTSNNFLSQTPKQRDNDPGNATNSKMERFGVMDSVLDDFAIAGPSGEMGLGQDDDMGPWWNYPIDDALQHDYSELLTELSGVTVNELSTHNSCSPIHKKNSYNQTIRGSSHSGSSLEQANESQVSSSKVGDSSRSSSGQFYPWSFQESQTSIPSLRSRVPNVNSNNTSSTKHTVCGDSVQAQPSAGGFPSIKVRNQDSGLPNTNSGFMNFSLFSKPVALVRANLQNADAMVTRCTSGVERMGDKNKGTNPSSNNLAKATLVASNSGLRKELGSHRQSNLVPPKTDSNLPESHAAEQSEAVCREDAVKNDKLPNQVLAASASKGIPDRGKTIEPPVAASSVCSANSAERASNDPTHNLKRKFQEADDSDSRSEDVEEDSVGVRKAPPARGGTSSKRSRAAEVHNLSERRRRDRINEKMRALQELIPNCNKVDKASMLDEAIEYLKTLQLQVQIMSMGAGLYMPPMMLPTGMQHVHAAHMANFSPMAVGMGMGMGFGMGILDMNGGPPRCPMIQMSPMRGTHYPAQCLPPFSGPTNFQGMVGSNLQVFGHPGQGIPISAPFAHSVPLSGGPPVNPAMQPIANGMAVPLEVPNSAPSSNSKDLIQHTNLQMMHNTDASSSMNQKSNQATNDGFEQSTLVLNNDQVPGVGSGEDISLTKENEIRPTCCE